jgi:hypothetical protein
MHRIAARYEASWFFRMCKFLPAAFSTDWIYRKCSIKLAKSSGGIDETVLNEFYFLSFTDKRPAALDI